METPGQVNRRDLVQQRRDGQERAETERTDVDVSPNRMFFGSPTDTIP